MDGVERGIRDRILSDLATSPVVLLEGLRASGKTWLARGLVADGYLRSFVDLTDGPTLERFRLDPGGSIAELPRPAVIDEVQLVPDVLLAVKRVADSDGAVGSFLLTGSARVRNDQLGGTDPLVGRAARAHLRPLTQGERRRKPIHFVDQLFDGALSPASFNPLTRRELAELMAIGGLPTIPGVLSVGGARTRVRQQLDYVERSLLSQPGLVRRDEAALARTFRYLAGNTAQILVTERVASHLGLNRKTVDAYIADLEARFLVERLPAWRATGSASARAHPKLHVTDSGLAAALAAPGSSAAGNDSLFGSRVESFAVMELIAQSGWSDRDIRPFHWRDSATKAEVDLVLVDSAGYTVAIEVKASTSVSRSDLRGIEAVAKRHPLDLGVVLYSGADLRSLGADRWAVPMASLWSQSDDARGLRTPSSRRSPAFAGDHPRIPGDRERSVPIPSGGAGVESDAAMFWSYVHADDDAEHGRISALAHDIAIRYELLTGETLPVFVDRDIEWGEQWKLRLGQELARTTFFVPIVTPRFLASEWCRAEVLEFVSKTKALGLREFVMPILYIRPDGIDHSDDPVAVAVRDSQWVEWENVRYLERTDGGYRRAIDDLVVRLQKARKSAEQAGRVSLEVSAGSAPPSEGSDLLETAERSSELIERLEGQTTVLMASLEGLGEAFETVGPILERAGTSPSPKQLRSALRDAVGPLEGPAGELEAESRRMSPLIAELDDVAALVIAAAQDPSMQAALGDLNEVLSSFAQMGDLDLDVSEAREVQAMIRQLALVAREMRPIARAIDATVQVLTDLDQAAQRWKRDAERALEA